MRTNVSALFCMACLGFQIAACADKMADNRSDEANRSSVQIEKVLKAESESLLNISGVVGTAQGLCNDQPCIKIFVDKLSPELEKKIHKHFEGYPFEIEETGTIRPLLRNKK